MSAAPVAIAVIGGGNMGPALVRGLIAAGTDPGTIAIVESEADRRGELATMFADAPGLTVLDQVPPAITAVIAVKPPVAVAAAVAAAEQGAEVIVSVAAGITTTAYDDALDDVRRRHRVAVVRSMPNTPALVGAAMTAICAGRTATEADLAVAEGILGAVGRCVRLPESDFDAVTAVTGSGPAYVMLLAESLSAAAVDVGLEAAVAEEMVTQLLVGSAALLAARGNPAALRDMVTSPGGTTAAALAVFEAEGLRETVLEAVRAAARRSRELGS